MGAEENKAKVRENFDRIWNQRDLDAVDRIFAADYTSHDVAAPEPLEGREAAKENFAGILKAFPDLNATVGEIVAEGDTLAFRWTMRGTHEGTLPQMGIEATGERVEIDGQNMARFRDGEVAEEWVNWDVAGLMRQIGAAP